jgi:flagellar biosynthesis anti-sigma factor FlgM
MMGKVDINKANGFGGIRSDRQNGVTNHVTEIGRAPENKKAVSADKVDFSGRGSEVGKLIEQMKALPDVRQTKVSNLRDQIGAGTYNPSGSQIANAIIRDER